MHKILRASCMNFYPEEPLVIYCTVLCHPILVIFYMDPGIGVVKPPGSRKWGSLLCRVLSRERESDRSLVSKLTSYVLLYRWYCTGTVNLDQTRQD